MLSSVKDKSEFVFDLRSWASHRLNDKSHYGVRRTDSQNHLDLN